MNTYAQILRKYESDLRVAIEKRDQEKGQSIDEALELRQSKDWYFIATTLDIIGDTNSAIQHFLETGLEGLGTKTQEAEKYLRLYGILNSTYLQQEAIVVLCQKIFHWNEKKSNGYFRNLRFVRFEIRLHRTVVTIVTIPLRNSKGRKNLT
jgi:hypothetical protein